ncbi:MAG: twin-arginine translocase TatA/TatE family subunit [Spirochaetes bacterium]|nr:twin-arginine translocase TatA/TatE family subunit [Spirochaetota bacterium]
MNIGPMEIGLILLVVLLLFGAKKLPELARSMGKAINEFKRGVKEISVDSIINAEPVKDEHPPVPKLEHTAEPAKKAEAKSAAASKRGKTAKRATTKQKRA